MSDALFEGAGSVEWTLCCKIEQCRLDAGQRHCDQAISLIRKCHTMPWGRSLSGKHGKGMATLLLIEEFLVCRQPRGLLISFPMQVPLRYYSAGCVVLLV